MTASIKRKKKLVAFFSLAIVLIAGAFAFYFFWRPGEGVEPIRVARGAIVEEVNVTGQTKPLQSVELAFEKGGRIVRVSVGVGDTVFAGQTLVALEASELLAERARAEANRDAEQAKLAELKRGARPEEIRLQEVKVANAVFAIEDAKRNIVDTLQDAYTKGDDAVRNRADQLISSPASANPQFKYLIDAALDSRIEAARIALAGTLVSWKLSVDALSPKSDFARAFLEAQKNLQQVRNIIEDISSAIASLSPSSTLTQAVIDGYRGDNATARTNINAALGNLSAAEEKLRSAEATDRFEEQQLAVMRAGSAPEAIAAQEARVKQAEAEVQSIAASLGKTVIRAPITGVVTRVDAKTGEIVAANTALVSIISKDQFEIEVNVSEVDIGKVRVGNTVGIRLDALPEESFSGRVVFIDPAETIIDGVVNFKIQIAFPQREGKVKSGLTANLAIETARRENALLLPQYAILENDRGIFVKKIEDGNAVETAVALGIRARDGMVEITEGVAEGDMVQNIGAKTSKK